MAGFIDQESLHDLSRSFKLLVTRTLLGVQAIIRLEAIATSRSWPFSNICSMRFDPHTSVQYGTVADVRSSGAPNSGVHGSVRRK